ncbi:predicted protein [Plenodomus lingam JN3]|uniref:Predicted protein n=1 Tax=Leptosphaeria maculans (strain JN3 / isolate v23.1.3 / race Av1-4-5-6-7-8) TaxID=985895 RepID=E4ZIY8_LEPMJ|nr:predicted protein [Plenodomus lingam JN3]CBX91258.1 predicted protein [Plenodomus lingam JN3]
MLLVADSQPTCETRRIGNQGFSAKTGTEKKVHRLAPRPAVP